ncbi:DNA-3-methyladenine glycosylase family protein [Sphingomonas oligoaromativorans]|uniref:DNA-3-methyladenine glycosylase family protein n=1 Tax=Sphingomonas oligoaromativorans TaxID=575322 RepID=UPI001422E9F0|nr:DNA-3-methyladenine glycosylase 2 family protein [Sphingomonas oligoaromativorans]NIJ33788.1 DNA-3-methyladenine glycosylase II [Sphingomonas oligoaromativorans]
MGLNEAARYAESTAFLAALDDDWAALIDRVGPCRHDPKAAREPYEALVRAIAYQQLTAKAGDAMINRLKAIAPEGGFPAPQHLVDAEFDALRGCGFSAAKIATIKGIGRWTVEMLLMYSLERLDILPADDFGVREGYRVLKSLAGQPKPRELRKTAEQWAPHRTVAAWYLWRVPPPPPACGIALE